MSTLRANTISNAAGTGPAALTSQWALKMTCQHNPTGTTVNWSNNVSSLTDNGTGDWTINFTNAFNAANEYAMASWSDSRNANMTNLNNTAGAYQAAGSCRVGSSTADLNAATDGNTSGTGHSWSAAGDLA